MSKNAIIGVAIALGVVAAGVGAFFGARQAVVRMSATEPAVPVSPALTPSAIVIPPGTATGPDGSVAEPLTATTEAPPVMRSQPADASAAVPAAIPRSRVGRRPATAANREPAAEGTPLPQAGELDAALSSGSTFAQSPVSAPPLADQPVAPPVTWSPPEPQFEELVIAADSVLGLELDSTVTSDTARIEDPVEAHVTRDVRVGSRVAVVAGTRVLGSVSQVEPGGKMKNRARLAVRFHTLVLTEGTRAEVQTDAVFREGDSPGQEAAGKMGAAAAGGAILGAILGGSRGAAIGGSIGAAGGAAAVMAGKRSQAVLQAGTAVTVRLQQPVGIMVER